jgi:3-methyl-2-oxobutanoate hydroxymethyltransferase
MLGMASGVAPRFAKHFAEVGEIMKGAFAEYKAAVQDGSFPAPEHTYAKSDCSDEFYQKLAQKY